MQNQIQLSIEDIHPYLRNINLYQCKPGFITGNRKLCSYYFLYVHKGKGTFIIGEKSYCGVTGDLFFCPPGVANAIIAHKDDPFLLTGIEFDFTQNNRYKSYPVYSTQLELFDPSKINELVSFTNFEGFPDKLSLPEDTTLRDRLYDMINEYNFKKLHWNHYVNGILQAFIISVTQRIAQYGSGIKNTCKGDEIIRYLTENYMYNLTNRHIAAKFHYHPDHISKIICAYTGITLRQYIIDLRIRAALNLLVHSDRSIENIASDVGYENLQYFYRIFKKKTGLCPGDFRENKSAEKLIQHT